MVKVEFKENKDLKLGLSLFGRIFNKKYPNLTKISEEAIRGNDINLEYKIDFPIPQIDGTSSYTIINIKVGNYRYIGWKEFGPSKGNWLEAKFSMSQAQKYVDSLKETLESL